MNAIRSVNQVFVKRLGDNEYLIAFILTHWIIAPLATYKPMNYSNYGMM